MIKIDGFAFTEKLAPRFTLKVGNGKALIPIPLKDGRYFLPERVLDDADFVGIHDALKLEEHLTVTSPDDLPNIQASPEK